MESNIWPQWASPTKHHGLCKNRHFHLAKRAEFRGQKLPMPSPPRSLGRRVVSQFTLCIPSSPQDPSQRKLQMNFSKQLITSLGAWKREVISRQTRKNGLDESMSSALGDIGIFPHMKLMLDSFNNLLLKRYWIRIATKRKTKIRSRPMTPSTPKEVTIQSRSSSESWIPSSSLFEKL